MEETHKLERQQKIQQQRLLELQQVRSRPLTNCQGMFTISASGGIFRGEFLNPDMELPSHCSMFCNFSK